MARHSVVLVNPLERHGVRLSRYHYYVFFCIFISKIPLFWHILSLIFLSPPMDYNCKQKVNGESKNVCPCDEPKWNRSIFEETMQTKFNLLCDTKWQVSLSQSMVFAGMLVGSFMVGFLSDRFGRVNMFSSSALLVSVAGALATVMPTSLAFSCMRFIEGMGVAGTIVTSYVICIEYCSVKHREVLTGLFHIPLNIGHATLPGVSYFLRDFDRFQLCISIPVLIFAFARWYIRETPKWLMDRGRIDEVSSFIEKTSRVRTSSVIVKDEIHTYLASDTKNINTKAAFWEIFKFKRLVINLLCMSVINFVCGIGYYGVSQFIGNMSGNIHLNVFISGVLLLPGTILSVFLLPIISRRTFLMIACIGAGAFMIAVICFPSDMTWVRVTLACVCNCLMFVAFIISILYAVELFPTSVRTSVLGVVSVLARIGQILGPIVNLLPENISGSVYGALAMIAGVMCCLLPETMNKELPSTLEQAAESHIPTTSSPRPSK